MWVKMETGETFNFNLIKNIYLSYSNGAATVVGKDINDKEVRLSYHYANDEKAILYKEKLERILDTDVKNFSMPL